MGLENLKSVFSGENKFSSTNTYQADTSEKPNGSYVAIHKDLILKSNNPLQSNHWDKIGFLRDPNIQSVDFFQGNNSYFPPMIPPIPGFSVNFNRGGYTFDDGDLGNSKFINFESKILRGSSNWSGATIGGLFNNSPHLGQTQKYITTTPISNQWPTGQGAPQKPNLSDIIFSGNNPTGEGYSNLQEKYNKMVNSFSVSMNDQKYIGGEGLNASRTIVKDDKIPLYNDSFSVGNFKIPPKINITGVGEYSNLKETQGWETLYNADGTAKTDKGYSYPFISKETMNKRYKSSTTPNWSRDSLVSEPYSWTDIGGDAYSFANRYIPLMRSIKDLARITQYMVSPDGLLNHTLINQNLPGLVSRVEYFEDGELKSGPQRFKRQYNPLSTLASVGGRIVGEGVPNALVDREGPNVLNIGSLFDHLTYTEKVSDITADRFLPRQSSGESTLQDQINNAIDGLGGTTSKSRPSGDPHTMLEFGLKKLKTQNSDIRLTYKNTLSEAHPNDNSVIEDPKYGMPFYFKDMRDGAFVAFRAYLEAITENIAPSWATHNYLGRSEPVYTYERTERDIAFTLKIFAGTESELAMVWKKINRLTSMCYPEYKHDQFLLPKAFQSGNNEGTSDPANQVRSQDFFDDSNLRMKPPFIRMRLGELYGSVDNEMIGFLRSVTYSVPEEGPWETKQGKRVPKHITAAITYQVINGKVPSLDFARQQDAMGNVNQNTFYGVNQEVGTD
tara:strand:+ start:1270 stop:3456 length:2187 start_codon:yes stop_codon:yes gene_type:complete